MTADDPRVIVDGHEDLSLGALADGRDYLTSAAAIRAAESEAGFENPNGQCMLGLADWLAARIAVIVASVQTIPRPEANPGEMSYATIEGAHQHALAHLDLYRRWAAASPQIDLVRDTRTLESALATWTDDEAPARACLEALETYEGPIVATHAHSRRTVAKARLLSDRVVEGIVAREGIVGVLPLNWALDPAGNGRPAGTT